MTAPNPPMSRQEVDYDHPFCEHGRDAFHDDCAMCDFAGTNWASGEGQTKAVAQEIDAGELWSFIGRILSQGAAIQQDYAAGKFESYEHYAARIDEAARERVPEFTAKFGYIPLPAPAAEGQRKDVDTEHTTCHWWCPKCEREVDWREGSKEISLGMAAGQGLHIPCKTKLEIRDGCSTLAKAPVEAAGEPDCVTYEEYSRVLAANSRLQGELKNERLLKRLNEKRAEDAERQLAERGVGEPSKAMLAASKEKP